MIHINRGDKPHEFLTDKQFKERYLELWDKLQPGLWESEGKKLREIRKSKSITLREMAKQLNINPSDLSDIEFGKIKAPDDLKSKYLTINFKDNLKYTSLGRGSEPVETRCCNADR